MPPIPLVGPTYQSKSVAAECQRTMNWYIEAIESGAGKSGASAVLYPTPGLRRVGGAPGTQAGTWRGLLTVPISNGAGGSVATAYGVSGSQFWQLLISHAAVPGNYPVVGCYPRGGVIDDGDPVTLVHNGLNGHQVCIAGGKVIEVYDINTAAMYAPTLAISPVIDCTFIDGYFIALSPTKFQISGLYNGLTWDAADVASRSEGADPFVACLQNHREVWLFGEITTEVWYNTGAADFPFAPIPGVFIELGCAATHSVVRFNQSLAWLARTREGDRLAVVAAQYDPQRVSTHAIEQQWRTYETVDDARSFVYQEEGHTFWVITFPSARATWAFDAATQLWHERSYYNPSTGEHEAHRMGAYTRLNPWHLVGDRASQSLYVLDNATAEDDVPERPHSPIRRVRRTPHISQENTQAFFAELELELENGLGLPLTGSPLAPQAPGVLPQAMLRWSDDRAHTWSSEWWLTAGAMGMYRARAMWNRLGASRDRVFELTVSDPVPWRLTGAYLHARQGTS